MSTKFLYNNKLVLKTLISIIILTTTTTTTTTTTITLTVEATNCNQDEYVYGINDIIDQLMVCSLSKSYDLDLTPQGEYVKSTSRALVDQGLSNKTTILYAKLSGLWSGKRTKFIDSGWKCLIDKNNVTKLSSIIEFNGLSLEVVERVDIPLHRNQHKLSIHKPCKTFDLPTWMCRTTKPIYRTTKTWVNSVYLNLILSQSTGPKNNNESIIKKNNNKPTIEKLTKLFTCPETFKQKITHSPSAMYILAKYMNQQQQQQSSSSSALTDSVTKKPQQQININNKLINKKTTQRRDVSSTTSTSSRLNLASKLAADFNTQDGKSPTIPPYHNSVNLIMNQLIESVTKSINECINILDLDLTLINDYSSFKKDKLNDYYYNDNDNNNNEQINQNDNKTKTIDLNELKCSDKYYISQRIELANKASELDNNINNEQELIKQDSSQMKRSQYMLKYPDDPNQLLNPYGFYHDNADRMIDDN